MVLARSSEISGNTFRFSAFTAMVYRTVLPARSAFSSSSGKRFSAVRSSPTVAPCSASLICSGTESSPITKRAPCSSYGASSESSMIPVRSASTSMPSAA